MLSELVAASERFRQEGKIGPPAYDWKGLHWIIELSKGAAPALQGPYRKNEIKRVMAPARQRSGTIGPDNLKPYLLADDARYALGIAERGKEREAGLAHEGFVAVLRKAAEATGDRDLVRVVGFLEQPLPEEFRTRIAPRDEVTFRCGPGLLPIETREIQRFWADYLASDLLAGITAPCAACGRDRPILRTLPVPVAIMGQRCQITSFNAPAFASFGKAQTTNSPLCCECAMSATQALQYMTVEQRHHATLAKDETKGRRNPLRNQLAVFWLKMPESPVVDENGLDIDLEAACSAPARPGQDGVPPPELGQLERLVRLPLTGQAAALRLDTNAFYLAVLSANKGRLLVREWISVSLGELRARLGAFLQATRVVTPSGRDAQVATIPALIAATASGGGSLGRALIRTAYLGAQPPEELLEAAVLRFRVPDAAARDRKEREGQEQRRHTLVAGMKLVLTYLGEEAKTLERLDPTRDEPAYLCGRLLAILEEIQQRASGWKLNSTLVDRFYGGASTAPASTFGTLINVAETGHLPKLRKEGGSYDRMKQLLEDVLERLDTYGFPATLLLRGQGEFALGFYHQRARFRAEREERRAYAQSNKSETGGAQ